MSRRVVSDVEHHSAGRASVGEVGEDKQFVVVRGATAPAPVAVDRGRPGSASGTAARRDAVRRRRAPPAGGLTPADLVGSGLGAHQASRQQFVEDGAGLGLAHVVDGDAIVRQVGLGGVEQPANGPREAGDDPGPAFGSETGEAGSCRADISQRSGTASKARSLAASPANTSSFTSSFTTRAKAQWQ